MPRQLLFALSARLLAGFVIIPADAGGNKKKGDHNAVVTTKGTLFTYIDEKGALTSIDIINMNPKAKFANKIESFDVNSATKFVLVDGAKKSTYNAKTVLTDARAKTGFQKENAVTL